MESLLLIYTGKIKEYLKNFINTGNTKRFGREKIT
jgi:hypothetical protein